MQLREGLDGFIKDDIIGYIDAPCGGVKAFKTFMLIAISKKDTLLGSELKFVLIVGTKVRSTSTLKDM
jgi:hypothetical protein